MPNLIQTSSRLFLFILFFSSLSALLGAGFGLGLATLSPDFVNAIVPASNYPMRYCAALGSVLGLFIGVGASCFAILVASIVRFGLRDSRP